MHWYRASSQPTATPTTQSSLTRTPSMNSRSFWTEHSLLNQWIHAGVKNPGESAASYRLTLYLYLSSSPCIVGQNTGFLLMQLRQSHSPHFSYSLQLRLWIICLQTCNTIVDVFRDIYLGMVGYMERSEEYGKARRVSRGMYGRHTIDSTQRTIPSSTRVSEKIFLSACPHLHTHLSSSSRILKYSWQGQLSLSTIIAEYLFFRSIESKILKCIFRFKNNLFPCLSESHCSR